MKMQFNKLLVSKVLIVGIPTYAIALMTEQMVYTMPMLAITTLIATNLSNDTQDVENRIDEDGEDGEDGESLVEGSMFGDG
jgi:hypothetical protein